MTTESLEKEILKLSKNDKLILLDKLIKNLNKDSDQLGGEQINEADRRYEELKYGTAQTIAAKQVFSELAEKYDSKS